MRWKRCSLKVSLCLAKQMLHVMCIINGGKQKSEHILIVYLGSSTLHGYDTRFFFIPDCYEMNHTCTALLNRQEMFIHADGWSFSAEF